MMIRLKNPKGCLLFQELSSTLVKARTYSSICSSFYCCQLVIEMKFKPGWGVDSDNWPIVDQT